MTTGLFDANAYENRDAKRKARASRCIKDAMFFRQCGMDLLMQAKRCKALGRMEDAEAYMRHSEFLEKRCGMAVADAKRIVDGG